ncbi:MAG: J domain-containing protein [Terricaulis sp.]
MARWPAVAFALAAFWELSRGGLELALVCALLAIASWYIAPRILAPTPAKNFAEAPADLAARAVLGVNTGASETEIRRAYRAKMAKAHPDLGGSQAEAARLTAARDQLLRPKR